MRSSSSIFLVALPLPRKGTETRTILELDMIFLVLLHYLFPARGLKLFYRTINSWYFHLVALPLPRKGTETETP